MSDTMPERVWLLPRKLNEHGVPLLGKWQPAQDFDRDPLPVGLVYVPESRLLAAEARVREVEAERRQMVAGLNSSTARQCAEIAAFRAERDALQADLKALLPLARLGLLAIDANSYFPVRAIEWGLIDWHRRDTANLTAARAILDREGV